MKLLAYITIKNDEDLDAAKSKIKRELGTYNWVVWNKPSELTGNQKVLQLSSPNNATNIVKIDGPGFIIDKLFNFFGGKNEWRES